MIKSGRTIAGIPFGRLDARVEITGQEAMDAFWKSKSPNLNTSDEDSGLILALGTDTTFANQPVTITLKIRPSHAVGTL